MKRSFSLLILLRLSIFAFAGETDYTDQAILNRVFRTSSGGSLAGETTMTSQAVLNSVFVPTQNALNISLGSSTNTFTAHQIFSGGVTASSVTVTGDAQFNGLITKSGMYQFVISTGTPATSGDYYTTYIATIPANTVSATGQGIKLIWFGKHDANTNATAIRTIITGFATSSFQSGNINVSADTFVYELTILKQDDGFSVGFGNTVANNVTKSSYCVYGSPNWASDLIITMQTYTTTNVTDLQSYGYRIEYIR